MKHERTKKTDISPAVRAIIYERDGDRCRLCGNVVGLSVAHYVPRSKGGLGIPENLILLCHLCHHNYDHTTKRQAYMVEIGMRLDELYPNFPHENRFYKR